MLIFLHYDKKKCYSNIGFHKKTTTFVPNKRDICKLCITSVLHIIPIFTFTLAGSRAGWAMW